MAIPRSPAESPHKGQWRETLMFSLICAWKKGWANKLRRWWFKIQRRSLWRHCNVSISWHWDGYKDIWMQNPVMVSYIVKTVAANVLATQGARASAVMVLSQFPRNIAVSNRFKLFNMISVLIFDGINFAHDLSIISYSVLLMIWIVLSGRISIIFAAYYWWCGSH